MNANQVADLFRSNPDQFANIGTPANYATTLVSTRDVRQTVSAGYGQIQTCLTSKFTVVGGLRWERTQNEFNELNPRQRDEIVAAGYTVDTSVAPRPSPALTISSAAGRGCSAPPSMTTSSRM